MKMIEGVRSVCCLCLVFCAASALSATLNVGPTDPYQTIQSAIEASVAGDTIVVSPGRYPEHINFLGKNVTVTSTNPDNPAVVESTIIDAGGSGSAVTFNHGEGTQAVLIGFTVTGGYGTVNPDISASAIIYWGAGIYCENASPTITQNMIQGNNGPMDGQTKAGYGGGIGCFQSNPIITRNNIRQNQSYAGAGIFIYIGRPVVANNMIYNNSATIGGGVILLMGGELIHNTIVNNTAQTAGNIYADADAGYPVRIINNIIVNASNGGGVYCQGFDQYISIFYNDVWNNTGGNYNNLPDQTGLNHNISLNPQCFDLVAGDFRLLAGSPCIDAGNNELIAGLAPFDFNGQSRPTDGNYDGEAIVDIGAFETEGATSPVIIASTGKISFTVFEGNNPDAKVLMISNGGRDVLDWTIEESCSWLEMTPLSGSSTGPGDGTEVTVSVNTAGMLPGSYECTFNIVAPGAMNTPETICITLYISAVGEIIVPLMFPTIQQAIDNAVDTNRILVLQGTYNEKINLRGKNIVLTSIEPTDWNIVESTVIRGNGSGPVVTLAGTETSACILQGFRIEGGNAPYPGGGGIYGISAMSLATIRNCIIQNNTTTDSGGGVGGCKGLIANCIIRNNSAKYGGGLSYCDGLIKNCLVVNNTATTAGNAIHRCNGQILNCTLVSDKNIDISQVDSCAVSFTNSILYGQYNIATAFTGTVTYCCYPGAATGTGNISANPLFVNPAGGDYHLSDESPCINAGSPAFTAEPGEKDMDNESRIVFGRVDIGADEIGNFRPIADAGPDQIMDSIPSSVTLDGSGSFDAGGDMLTYQWQQIAGPDVILSGDDTPTATFIPTELGIYVFELAVSDGVLPSNPDQVEVVIGNYPIADAGLTVYAKTGVAVLDGRGSYDRRGYVELKYQWRQISGDALTILSPQSPQPKISGFVRGNSIKRYKFELTVSNEVLSSKPDTVTLVVLPTFQEGVLYQPELWIRNPFLA